MNFRKRKKKNFLINTDFVSKQVVFETWKFNKKSVRRKLASPILTNSKMKVRQIFCIAGTSLKLAYRKLPNPG